MKPGRELDALVAEKVMGWKHCGPYEIDLGDTHSWSHEGFPPGKDKQEPLPHYSTSIADAWEVARRLRAQSLPLALVDTGYSSTGWKAEFNNASGLTKDAVFGDTAPHAICLAALKAVEK